jgi:hypothetical protein
VTKNTLIRSDKKHAVNMPAGSNVAERKTTRKFSEPDTPVEAPANIQKLPPTKATPAKRKTAPPPAAKTVRAKATLTRTPAPSPTQPTKATKARPTTSKTKAATAPSLPVWGKDSQVKQRIEQLKTRNAQLAEQLQRLPTSATARGKRP